jgi:deoxyadenosine/deoxycytidine kinase
MRYLALVFAASTTLTSALAQTAPAAVDAAAPRHNCARPAMLDTSKKFTQSDQDAFVAATKKFKECAEGFAQAQQKEAERVQKAAQVTAQALVAAGNVAIKDYNDFVAEADKAMAAKAAAAKAPVEVSREGNVDTVPSRIPRKY